MAFCEGMLRRMMARMTWRMLLNGPLGGDG